MTAARSVLVGLVGALAVAGLVAGCGGSDDDASSAPSTTEATVDTTDASLTEATTAVTVPATEAPVETEPPAPEPPATDAPGPD